MKPVKNKYYCKHCGKTVTRASSKKWYASFCATTEKDVRMIRIDKPIKNGKRNLQRRDY